MLRHLGRRLLGAGARLLLISLVLFLLLQVPPGGPADIYAADPSASPDAIARMRALWGLDRPLLVQYAVWLRRALAGDWGRSFAEQRAVAAVVLERLPATLVLTGSALASSLVLGLVLGAAGAATRRRGPRAVLQALSVVGMSVPTFWGGSLVILFFAVWTTVARLVRSQVLTLRGWPFVEAARGLGASRRRILARHIAPNVVTPVLVAGTLLVANAVLVESALSLLGFGLPPPTATWGGMLHAAQVHFTEAPWLGVFPGLAIVVAVASVNFLGEGLREMLDPRLR